MTTTESFNINIDWIIGIVEDVIITEEFQVESGSIAIFSS